MSDAYRAFASEDMSALVEFLDPDVEWKAVEDPEPKRGLSGVLESLAGWYEVWDEMSVDLEELIDAGTSIVAVVNLRGRHAESRREMTERFFQVWTIRHRKIARFHEYRTRHEAFGAVGLSEQDTHADS